MKNKSPLIGFVGQGYVGGSYANNFEKRGLSVVRYSLEPKYIHNKEAIASCDIVFVCVPTPTTPKGFDDSIVAAGLSLVGKGNIAVIKSTMLPGRTATLQKKFPGITLLCSPEFLSVVTAQYDADHPFSNIIGMSKKSAKHQAAAKLVQSVLPEAGFSLTCSSEEAEVIKYAHNLSGYTQVITFNALYDMAEAMGADWGNIHQAMLADPLVPNRYSNPVHKKGRGAGGGCFIKDMAAFARLYEQIVRRPQMVAYLKAVQASNIALLVNSKKDLDLLEGVYGKTAMNAARTKAKKHR